MDSGQVEHRLAAIVAGDIVDYSRLIAADENEAVRLVNAYRQEIELLVGQHHGRLVDFAGDNFLAEFSSSLSAVRCAVEIQNVLQARNRSLTAERRMEFRLGFHGKLRRWLRPVAAPDRTDHRSVATTEQKKRGALRLPSGSVPFALRR